MTTVYRNYVMAVDRVEKRLRNVTAALDAAGIRYAVIGGNAVAAWVARVDPAATRSTRDVDLLVRREDETSIAKVMTDLGFERVDLRRLVVFVDPDEPSKRSGVHLVWADELVRPSYAQAAPSVEQTVRDPQGFAVLDLPALVTMKLTSFGDLDRVHVADLLEVGLIDDAMKRSLPDELVERLNQIARSQDESM